MNKVEVIIKVTNSCNLRCKYCYNGEKRDSECLSLQRFEKLLTVLITKYNSISLLWHGGEPILAGLDYFKSAMDIVKRFRIQYGVDIENSIQTNGTLIDKNWIKFFKDNDFHIGISFDGINNEKYRQQTDKVLSAIQLLKKNKVRFGCNAVVADNEYDLVENYRFMAKNKIPFDFSPVFYEGCAKTLQSFNWKDYANSLVRLFDEWVYDVDGVSIRTFNLYINYVVGGPFRICTSCSCHGKYLSITPDGTVYNCGRDSLKKYPFFNIEEVNTVDELFSSKGAKALLKGAIERREKCRQKCEYFNFCAGGCSDIAVVQGGLSDIPKDYCEMFKTIYSYVESKMKTIFDDKVPLSKLNPSVKKVLADSIAKLNPFEDSSLKQTYS